MTGKSGGEQKGQGDQNQRDEKISSSGTDISPYETAWPKELDL